jgi:hypothetical protein
MFLPKLPAETDQKKKKICFKVTALSSVSALVRSHYENSHLFWWRPSLRLPAEMLLAVVGEGAERTETRC